MTNWKPVTVEVSEDGRVRFLGKILRQHKRGQYRAVTISAHRLIAVGIHGQPSEDRPFVNHIDCNPHNNVASNLEWVNAKENKERTPNTCRGEKVHTTNLTHADVLAILSAKPTYATLGQLANEMGVSTALASHFRRRKKSASRHLSANQLQQLREWVSPNEIAKQLGLRYGVSRNSIQNIWGDRTWKHIPRT